MSDRPNPELVPDAKRVLDEYLRVIDFRSEVYFRGQVCEDWYLDTSGSGHINVHVVCHGDCWFRLPGLNEPQQLYEGDVVVLPHDATHLLLSAPGLPAEYGVISKPHQVPHNRDAPGTALFCGYLIVDQSTFGSVFAMLPEYLIIRSHQGDEAQQFRALIDLLFAETQADQLGSGAILDRLADAMMFYVIRHALAQGAQSAGLLVGLADKQLRPALVAMCDEPAQAWSVDALAERVFMSRSSFAERFNTLVGKTPMEFLAEWRMQRARRWLERDRLSVAEVAERCGYQSETAFSKAFKRIAGVGPGEFRRARAPK
jgi:AraC family transcriptional regulator, activator of mtrCDE